jgi:lipopolysaccharide export system protein LptA
MRLRLIVLAALLALATPAFAQNKVSITADLFTIDEATREAVFTGNVVVKHPTVTVHAPKVIAHYGEGGTSDIESFEAFGPGVELITEDQTATGDNAVFTPADQLLRLTGNVVVVNSGGRVSAGELVHNLDTNQSTFTSNEGERVTGVFTSQ